MNSLVSNMYFPLHLQKQLQDVHAKARRAAFEHYIRKGRVPPDLAELVEATRTVPNFLAKYSPDQPRVPAGNPDGGQWTSGGGGGSDGNGNQPSQMVQQEVPPVEDLVSPEDLPAEPSESGPVTGSPPTTIKPPLEKFPADPTQPPGPGYVWRGSGPPESGRGNWVNPGTGEKLYPDINHKPPQGPHWDYENPQGKWRWYPDGRMEPKNPLFLITT